MDVRPHCAVPCCEEPRALENGAVFPLCRHHLSMTSQDRRERLSGLLRRREFLGRKWSDEAVFDALVAKDRYFKLVGATFNAEENVARFVAKLSQDLQDAAA